MATNKNLKKGKEGEELHKKMTVGKRILKKQHSQSSETITG